MPFLELISRENEDLKEWKKKVDYKVKVWGKEMVLLAILLDEDTEDEYGKLNYIKCRIYDGKNIIDVIFGNPINRSLYYEAYEHSGARYGALHNLLCCFYWATEIPYEILQLIIIYWLRFALLK